MMVAKMMSGLIRKITHAALLTGVLSVAAAGAVMLFSKSAEDELASMEAATTEAGWGSEALAQIHEGASRMSPVSLANACGMGASSCFKCHNGKRADAPNMDSAAAPWHTDHKTVNGSCMGCHQGNPRVMKQDVAHKNLLADPTKDTDTGCVSCHKGDDMNELNAKYLNLLGGGN